MRFDCSSQTEGITFNFLFMSYNSLAAKESAEPQNSYKAPYSSIVLHVPHAKNGIPDLLWTAPQPHVTSHQEVIGNHIMEESRPIIDWYTDELFVPSEENKHIKSIVFQWNRAICDVCAPIAHDPLEKKMGICMFTFCRWRMKTNVARATCFKNYVAHHHALEDLLTECSAAQERRIYRSYPSNPILLIDCHSFSASPTALCSEPGDIDICIGYNDDWSRPSDDTLQVVTNYFQEKGYKVGINAPFSGSKTVEIPINYHSLKIEVSKRLYMNEETLKKTKNFAQLQSDLQALYPLLLNSKQY